MKLTSRKIERNKEELNKFRKELKDKGYTEVNLTYREGAYIVKYITASLTLAELRDYGLINARAVV